MLLEKHLAPPKQTRPQCCMDHTRMKVLSQIERCIGGPPQEQARTPLSGNLLWLTGFPGAGKSSVAASVVRMASSSNMRYSYFFCKRGDPMLSSAAKILPTLAHGLCSQDGEYRQAILRLLRGPDCKKLEEQDIDIQFDLLFRKPASGIQETHVIVIDALDECYDRDMRRVIAKQLVLLAQLSPHIKVFVTSRREDEIESVFRHASGATTVNISDDEATNNQDIETYAHSQLMKWGVPSDDIDRLTNDLVLRAAGLFIWCSTLFKHLDGSLSPVEDLEEFLSSDGKANAPGSIHLSELYDQVVDSPATNERDRMRVYLILGIIFIAERPLSSASIAKILGPHPSFSGTKPAEIVEKVVRLLSAVLYEQSQENGRNVIRTHHPSFLDYLKSKIDAATNGWTRLEDLHRILAKHCLDVLHAELKFNICRLSGPPVLNTEIRDLQDVVNTHISPELQYGSQCWCIHVSRCSQPQREAFLETIQDLLRGPKSLFWMEIMSALGRPAKCAIILGDCAQIFQVRTWHLDN